MLRQNDIENKQTLAELFKHLGKVTRSRLIQDFSKENLVLTTYSYLKQDKYEDKNEDKNTPGFFKLLGMALNAVDCNVKSLTITHEKFYAEDLIDFLAGLKDNNQLIKLSFEGSTNLFTFSNPLASGSEVSRLRSALENLIDCSALTSLDFSGIKKIEHGLTGIQAIITYHDSLTSLTLKNIAFDDTLLSFIICGVKSRIKLRELNIGNIPANSQKVLSDVCATKGVTLNQQTAVTLVHTENFLELESKRKIRLMEERLDFMLTGKDLASELTKERDAFFDTSRELLDVFSSTPMKTTPVKKSTDNTISAILQKSNFAFTAENHNKISAMLKKSEFVFKPNILSTDVQNYDAFRQAVNNNTPEIEALRNYRLDIGPYPKGFDNLAFFSLLHKLLNADDCNITRIDISYPLLTAYQASSFFFNLSENHKVVELNLSGCIDLLSYPTEDRDLETELTHNFSLMLEKNKTLKNINLSGIKNIQLLLTPLIDNNFGRLKRILLNDNEFPDKWLFEDFCKAIKKNITLEVIEAEPNPNETTYHRAIAGHIAAQQKHLQSQLIWGGNDEKTDKPQVQNPKKKITKPNAPKKYITIAPLPFSNLSTTGNVPEKKSLSAEELLTQTFQQTRISAFCNPSGKNLKVILKGEEADLRSLKNYLLNKKKLKSSLGNQNKELTFDISANALTTLLKEVPFITHLNTYKTPEPKNQTADKVKIGINQTTTNTQTTTTTQTKATEKKAIDHSQWIAKLKKLFFDGAEITHNDDKFIIRLPYNKTLNVSLKHEKSFQITLTKPLQSELFNRLCKYFDSEKEAVVVNQDNDTITVIPLEEKLVNSGKLKKAFYQMLAKSMKSYTSNKSGGTTNKKPTINTTPDSNTDIPKASDANKTATPKLEKAYTWQSIKTFMREISGDIIHSNLDFLKKPGQKYNEIKNPTQKIYRFEINEAATPALANKVTTPFSSRDFFNNIKEAINATLGEDVVRIDVNDTNKTFIITFDLSILTLEHLKSVKEDIKSKFIVPNASQLQGKEVVKTNSKLNQSTQISAPALLTELKRAIIKLYDNVDIRKIFLNHLLALIPVNSSKAITKDETEYQAYYLRSIQIFIAISQATESEDAFALRNLLRHCYQTLTQEEFYTCFYPFFIALNNSCNIVMKNTLTLFKDSDIKKTLTAHLLDAITQLNTALAKYKDVLSKPIINIFTDEEIQNHYAKITACLFENGALKNPLSTQDRDAALQYASNLGELREQIIDGPFKEIYIELGHYSFGQNFDALANKLIDQLITHLTTKKTISLGC